MSSGWKVGRVNIKVGGYQPAAGAPSRTRDPANDRARLQTIDAAADAGDIPRASVLAEQALADGLEHPLVLHFAAMKLQGEGRLDEALEALARAVELDPQDVDSFNAMGLIQARLARFPEALAAFEAAVALDPDFAGAHCARGTCLEALERFAEAEAAYRRALALEPDNLGARQGLANHLSREGDHAAARPLAEAVLAAQPSFPDAVIVLARADAAEGARERARGRLDLLLGDARLPPLQRARVQNELAMLLDTPGASAP